MRLAFRADSSSTIGVGHIMRLLNIAEPEDIFICKTFAGNIISYIREKGIAVYEISETLGENEDGEAAIEILRKENIKTIVVDHYGLGEIFISSIKKEGIKCAVFDDLGERKISCDIIINQNLYGNKKMYDYLTEPYVKIAAGGEYTMLREEFTQKVSSYEVKPEIKRVLITLGGGDSENISQKIAEILENKSFEVIIAAGRANRNKEKLKQRFENSKDIKIVENLENMRKVFEMSDFIICAGGTTLWEVIYTGVPFGVVKIADNQKLALEYIKDNRCGIILGEDSVLNEEIVKKIKGYSYEERERASLENRKLLDGKGRDRIREIIEKIGI